MYLMQRFSSLMRR